jgi:hypothetical protein
MASARSYAISAVALLIALAIGLLLFGCIHWRNAWSLFILLPYALAIFVPNICRNCTPFDELPQQDITMDEAAQKNCRELGWTLAIVLLLTMYCVPVLAWYNAGFGVWGAVVVMVADTAFIWVYLLYVRVFGTYYNT